MKTDQNIHVSLSIVPQTANDDILKMERALNLWTEKHDLFEGQQHVASQSTVHIAGPLSLPNNMFQHLQQMIESG